MTTINPTVGRKIWYRPSEAERQGYRSLALLPDIDGEGFQPLDATIVGVHGADRINLLVVDAIGRAWPRLNILLIQEGDMPPDGEAYAQWMPYQTGQAQKAAEAAKD